MKVQLQNNKPAMIVGVIAILAIALLLTRPTSSTQLSSSNVAMNRHSQQVVQFFTQVIGSQKRTRIYFPFSFEKNIFPLIIGYQLENQTIKEFLVFHPQLSNLDWPIIREDGLTLFQKEKKHQSIQEFLESPSGNIVADDYLKQKYPKLNAKSINSSNKDPIDLSNTDFILSTIAPIKAGNATYYYENVLDTSDALLNEEGNITWIVRAQDANEEDGAYNLGNIDVSYLQ